MATLFTDDFDGGGALSDKYALVASNMYLAAGDGIGGSTGCGSNTAPYVAPWLVAAITPSPADIITVRYWQWIPPGSMPFGGFLFYAVGGIHWANGAGYSFANRQVSINTTVDGKFFFLRGDNTGTTIAGPTTNPVWVENEWNEIEYEIKIHDTTGYIILRKAGVEVLNATGLDTKFLGTAAIDGIEIVPQSVAGVDAVIDNIQIRDTSAASPRVGCLVAGVKTRVAATRAIAFGLDDNSNLHDEAGKFKVFGDFEVTGTTTLAGITIEGQYGSLLFDAGSSGAAITLDLDNGNTQLVTLTSATSTITLTNPRDGGRYLLLFEQDGSGSRVPSLPSSVKFSGGATPTWSTVAGKVDLVTLVWVAGIGASGNYLAAANTDYTPA